MTAQYWAWKNLKDVEYVGLCHYRRYFETIITSDNIDSVLGTKYDALCVSPLHERTNIAQRLIIATCIEDYQIFMYCFKKVHPQYFESVKHFFKHGVVVPYNMFVMKKELFDEFAEWQFSIFTEMEKYVRLSGYSRARRLYGYFAEMLLPIYLKYHHKKIKYNDYVSMVGERPKKIRFGKLKAYINDFILWMNHSSLRLDGDAVMVGFQLDGINIGKVND